MAPGVFFLALHPATGHAFPLLITFHLWEMNNCSPSKMPQSANSLFAIGAAMLLFMAAQGGAEDQRKSIDAKETVVGKALPEELMLQKLSMLKKLRPPLYAQTIRKLFDTDASETSVGVGRVTQVWKITPGYEIRFVSDSTPPFEVSDAWIERTLPYNARLEAEPGVDANVSMERYRLVNSRWTKSGLEYVYEITANSEYRLVVEPFTKLKGTKQAEGGAEKPVTEPESKTKDDVDAKPAVE